jgi:UDP-N-acetylglucosamine diphosphorylase/glucosamine-1-phosphate N-acetyltransferase
MGITTLCVFEDECYENFLPLTYTKATFELVCGSKTLLERAVEALRPQKVLLVARDYLKEKLEERTGFTVNEAEVEGDALIVNGRLLIDSHSLSILDSLKLGEALTNKGFLVAMKLGEGVARGAIANKVFKPRLIKSLASVKEVDLELVEYPWQLLELTSKLLDEVSFLGERYEGDEIKVLGDLSMLRTAGEVQVEGLVVVDVRRGPVYIGRGCEIEGYTKIEGPAYIGDSCVIRGAYIRSKCYIGKVCRIGVGSELEKTIISGYTNKQHLGFIGHSYVGEWVNIGAGTNVSDLKNTYGTVKVTVRSAKVDTGLIKLGCFVGDHVKTSIGTQIYSGKKIGPFSHVHGFVYEDVPPFTIWAKSLGAEPVELALESAIETQRRMYERRGVSQTKADVELVKKLFELTAEERAKSGVKKEHLKLT